MIHDETSFYITKNSSLKNCIYSHPTNRPYYTAPTTANTPNTTVEAEKFRLVDSYWNDVYSIVISMIRDIFNADQSNDSLALSYFNYHRRRHKFHLIFFLLQITGVSSIFAELRKCSIQSVWLKRYSMSRRDSLAADLTINDCFSLFPTWYYTKAHSPIRILLFIFIHRNMMTACLPSAYDGVYI